MTANNSSLEVRAVVSCDFGRPGGDYSAITGYCPECGECYFMETFPPGMTSTVPWPVNARATIATNRHARECSALRTGSPS